MYALDNESGVAVMPPVKAQKKAPNEPQWFTEGGNGVAPTYPGADWFNIMQAELLNILTDAGMTPNKAQLNQLALAIRTLARKEIANIPAASGTVSGILRLTDSINMASSVFGASAQAVKTAFGKAVEAKNAADRANSNAESRLSKSGGNITGNLSIGGRLTASNIIEIKEGSEKQNLTNLFGSNVVWGIAGGDKNTLGLTQDMYNYGVGFSLSQSGTKALLYIPHRTNLQIPELWIKTHYNDSSYTPSNWTKVMMVNYLVGMPLPWMLSTVPEGFLAMKGQTFDKSRYPILAQRYPSGRLPDLRGEFIRGWDNGRNADPDRKLLSDQFGSFTSIDGGKNAVVGLSATINKNSKDLSLYKDLQIDPLTFSPPSFIYQTWDSSPRNFSSSALRSNFEGSAFNFNTGHIVGSVRPRNIAFQYICLAA